jgi:hypothetical protein
MISANTGHMTLAGAEWRRSREKSLLAERWIRSVSFVYDLTYGRTRPPGQRSHGMTRYLISFNYGAMDHIPDEDMFAVAKAAHAVVQEALDAGVYLFAGGLEFQRPSVVATDGTVTDGPYPQTKELGGGFTVVDVPTREAALEWAAKIAVACRCAQQVREFGPDPELDEMLRQADSRRRRPDDV